jgi:hypothetical protein
MYANLNGTDEDRAARAVDRLHGQAVATVLDDDRMQLITMPDRGTFSTAVIVTREDALRLADMINARFRP